MSAGHVIVIGGGASGVLLAAQLMARGAGVAVTLIERRQVLGCGLAYSTRDPAHLLNTRVHSMSAFPDRPHHFEDWLATRFGAAAPGPDEFVSRTTYGDYLNGLIAPGPAMECREGDVIRLEEQPGGVTVHLADCTALTGTAAVLATGHVLPARRSDDPLSDPWAVIRPAPEDRVAILGTGLTMVDQVLSLLAAGHRGEIVAISRRGLLPRGHRTTKAVPFTRGDLPFGRPLSAWAGWLRAEAAARTAAGGSWRDVMDGIRPHIRAIWRSLSVAERARFLRHAAAWWEVHRHRMPPTSEDRIAAAQASRQLRVMKAAFLRAEDHAGGVTLHLAPRTAGGPARLDCGRVIDCRGIRRDPEREASPLIADLLARGAARIDPLRIGLEVAPDCHLIDRDGRRSRRLLAIGPVSRAAFWEITAIPDIREQAAAVATDLAAGV